MNFSGPLAAIFPFENADLTYALDEVLERHQWFGFACGFVYVCSVFGIQWWMRNRTGYKLKSTAISWNLFLAFLNLVAAVRILPHALRLVTEDSFYASVCTDKSFMRDPVTGFWMRMFPYMKIIELGDTILIVLQKRRLVTYYWTHHLGALLVTWYLYPCYPTVAIWISVIINLTHVPVYLYGTIRSCGVSTPRFVAAGLIVLEIVHMMAGIMCCLCLFYYLNDDRYCTVSVINVTALMLVYLICFTLSITLFCTRFLVRSKKVSEVTISSTMTSVIPRV